jgi:hypothetical protein
VAEQIRQSEENNAEMVVYTEKRPGEFTGAFIEDF